MKTIKNGFGIGATVALNADLAWLHPEIVNIVLEVSDARCLNGETEVTVRVVGSNPFEAPKWVLFASDMHEVGR